MEEWKDIKGYEGLYKVSNIGRVKSLPRVDMRGKEVRRKIFNGSTTKDNYQKVCLCKDKKREYPKIHRLVLMTFNPIENMEEFEVNHIDGNKQNNNINNLEWVTKTENIRHAYKMGLKTDMKPRKVICVETGAIYQTISECSKDTKCNVGSISRVCQGKTKTTHGLHFKYLEDWIKLYKGEK